MKLHKDVKRATLISLLVAVSCVGVLMWAVMPKPQDMQTMNINWETSCPIIGKTLATTDDGTDVKFIYLCQDGTVHFK